MPNNPYSQTCEKLCSKLERFERAKQNFKILQTDFTYNSTTNKYSGTYMNIEVAGEIFFITSANIVISNSTNTVIVNIGYNGTNLTTGITTEQKTVSQASTLMASNTYASSASTCSFTIPVLVDGIETSGAENLCQKLAEEINAVPNFLTKPTTFQYTNGNWNVAGTISVQKGQSVFKKDNVTFTGTGNNLFLKIYANTNNFELYSANFASPTAVETFVKSNTTNCIYYIPIGFGDGTIALQHYVHTYDVYLAQFKELNISRHFDEALSFSGRIFRVGGNTQGVTVRGGIRDNSFNKINHDNRRMINSSSNTSFIGDDINVSESGINLPNTNFTHAHFNGSLVNLAQSFEMFYNAIGTSDSGQYREKLSGSIVSFSGSAPKSFFVKNVVAVSVTVRLETITRGLIWLMSS